MAIDTIARGLAISLIGPDGKIASEKMPVLSGISDISGFYPLGNLKDASAVEGKTAEEILMMMLFGVMNPTLTEPSLNVELNAATLIIGSDNVVSGKIIFNRGSIEPAYGTSGYRAGAATQYTVNGQGVESADFSIAINPVVGENVIPYTVSYAQGEQPLNSIGAAYNQPLAAGALTSSFVVTAIYPLYSGEGQVQEFTWFEEDDGQGYLSAFVAEINGEKQNFAIAAEETVTGIKALNILTQQWDWLGGSAEESLTYFDQSTTTIDGVDYVVYTHNQADTYARELRIYVEF